MIRPATKEDLCAVCAIYEACKVYLCSTGMSPQWQMGYPNKKVALAALERGDLFVFQQNGTVCATVILNDISDEEYALVVWKYDLPFMLVHTLAVLPAYQRQGIARQLIAFAVEYALKNGKKALRLDTFYKNTRNNNLYRRLGFEENGALRFKRSPIDYWCICYEKLLTKEQENGDI